METHRRGVGTAAAVVVVLIVIAVGAASAFFISSATSAPTTSTTASVTGTTSTTISSSQTSISSANGLLLSLSLNSSSLAQGQGIAATEVVTNTLSTALNMTRASDWPISGLSLGPCGDLNQPMGLSIIQGNYNISNATSGTALQLSAPGAYACPAVFAIASYLFQPMSDNATVYGGCTPGGSCGNETISATTSVDGYYVGSNFTPFPAGVYTVVAGDEWGDVVVSHFTVA